MLVRICALFAVGVCLMAGQGAGAQQQGAAAADKTTLLQLAAPVGAMTSQLQKRNTKDNAALATGFTGGHHGHHHHAGHHLGHGGHGHGGKFFMYAHQPEHKHYEFGFKRGNDKHVVERYEKGGPHHNFKSKFRWHDKHGGHGERYWDYNHGDSHHHDDGGDGGHHHHDDHHDDGHHHDHHHDGGHGYHSEPVPEFVQPGAAYAKDAYRQKRKHSGGPAKKSDYEKKPTGLEKKMFVGPKEQQLFQNPLMMQASQPAQQPQSADAPTASQAAFNDMLGFDPFSPPEILKDHSSVGGINSDSSTPSYRTQPSTMPPPIAKPYFSRNSEKKANEKKYKGDNAGVSSEEVPKLAFDLDSGRVFDEKTGKWFRLVAD